MSGWAAIALENQALLTQALEKLAAAERERDTARATAVSLENVVHEARDGLQGLEWGEKDDTGNPNYDACLVCGWYRGSGHMDGCALVPLLARLAPS